MLWASLWGKLQQRIHFWNDEESSRVFGQMTWRLRCSPFWDNDLSIHFSMPVSKGCGWALFFHSHMPTKNQQQLLSQGAGEKSGTHPSTVTSPGGIRIISWIIDWWQRRQWKIYRPIMRILLTNFRIWSKAGCGRRRRCPRRYPTYYVGTYVGMHSAFRYHMGVTAVIEISSFIFF